MARFTLNDPTPGFFFSALGEQVHPLHPLATPMGPFRSFLTVPIHFVLGRPTVLSWILQPSGIGLVLPVTALVVHPYHMTKPARSSFSEYVLCPFLSSFGLDFFICGRSSQET